MATTDNLKSKKESSKPANSAAEENKVPKIRIRLYSFDYTVLDRATKEVVQLVLRNGGKVIGPVPLKTKKKVVVLLRSTLKHKDSRIKIQSNEHKRMIDIIDFGQDVVNSLSTLTLAAGVDADIQMM